MQSRPQPPTVHKEGTYKHLLKDSNRWALTFMLNTLLPLGRCEDHNLCDKSRFRSMLNNDRRVLFTGSTIQGLSNPYYASKNGRIGGADWDWMLIDTEVIIDKRTPHPGADDDNAIRGYSDTSETHPGYLQIELRNNAMHPRWVISERRQNKYLTSKVLFDSAEFKEFTSVFLGKLPNVASTSHGPAVTIVNQVAEGRSMDFVPAYVCCAWPAQEWIVRERLFSWPPTTLVEGIVSKGCHVVSKAHPLTTDPTLEFRYSFSAAENDLCDSLTMVQKQCYALFKMVLAEPLDSTVAYNASLGVIQQCSLLTSYHLKTVLFWMCENLPPQQWASDDVGTLLLALLDKLIIFLHKGDLPNYFMPENNMIDHLSPFALHTLVMQVEQARQDPIAHIFLFFVTRPIRCNPQADAFHEILGVIDSNDEATKLIACIQTLQSVGCSFIVGAKDHWELVIFYMEEQSRLLRKLGLNMSPYLLTSIMFTQKHLRIFQEGTVRLNQSALLTMFLYDVPEFLLVQGMYSSAVQLLEKGVNYTNHIKMIVRQSLVHDVDRIEFEVISDFLGMFINCHTLLRDKEGARRGLRHLGYHLLASESSETDRSSVRLWYCDEYERLMVLCDTPDEELWVLIPNYSRYLRQQAKRKQQQKTFHDDKKVADSL